MHPDITRGVENGFSVSQRMVRHSIPHGPHPVSIIKGSKSLEQSRKLPFLFILTEASVTGDHEDLLHRQSRRSGGHCGSLQWLAAIFDSGHSYPILTPRLTS